LAGYAAAATPPTTKTFFGSTFCHILAFYSCTSLIKSRKKVIFDQKIFILQITNTINNQKCKNN
jgi:hypothetical protein